MGQIKLIHKDTNMSELDMYKYDWDVVIRGRPYQVFNIQGYVHTIGGGHGENSMWACPRDEEPTPKNLIEYEGFGPTYSIHIDGVTNVDHKWGETRAGISYGVTILRNGEEFYSFTTNDPSWGWAKAYSLLIQKIKEGPINFNRYDFVKKEIEGRHIRYRGDLYTLVRYIPGQCCAMAVPGHRTRVKYDSDRESAIKLDLLESEHIDWYEPVRLHE